MEIWRGLRETKYEMKFFKMKISNVLWTWLKPLISTDKYPLMFMSAETYVNVQHVSLQSSVTGHPIGPRATLVGY